MKLTTPVVLIQYYIYPCKMELISPSTASL